MKNFLLLISLCLFSVITHAKTYYVSPAGSDANPGTITLPYKSISKLNSVMVAGDIAYLRGGTYRSTAGNGSWVHFNISGLTGTAVNPITISSYPGEVPTFNLDDITPTAFEPYGMAVTNCNYLKLKGHIIVKNFKQPADGFSVARGFMLVNSNQCTIEWLEVFNIMGPAFKIESSNDNLFLNCDAHHNGDGWSRDISSPTIGSDKWDNADGFSCSSNPTLPPEPSTRNTFRYCRAWMNSDDGWDVLGTGNDDGTGIFTLDGCWSFWNGIKPWGTSSLVMSESMMTPGTVSLFQDDPSYWSTLGNSGEGFKLGDTRTPTTQVLHYLTNCVAFQNKGTGFASNSINAVTGVHQLLNCVAYDNDNDGFSFGAGWCTGTNQQFKNNWSYANNRQASGADWVYDGNNNSNIASNLWTTIYQGVNYGNLYPNKKISNADFVSVSSAGVDGARQSNGALSVLTFLHLATGSDLINAGINVGLPYVSTAPDLGAFESGAVVVPVTLVDFSATEKTGKTLLQWSTATEINCSHFEVERSIDSRSFEKIGSVIANGNADTRIDYQFTDNYPVLGVNYYRLKIVDKDGQYDYSKIVSVNFRNNVNTGSFEIKSAVINQKLLKLNISSSKQQPAILGIYDATGRTIFVSDIILQKGMNNINELVTPASAVYYLKLKTNEEMVTIPILNGN